MSGMMFKPSEAKTDQALLDRLLKDALDRRERMTPLERAIADLEQRRSWVTGEMRMNDDASPNGVTAEQARARLSEVAPEYVVLDELLRRMKLDEPKKE
jgi:hypothetical protein